jgi:hypothetical protein
MQPQLLIDNSRQRPRCSDLAEGSSGGDLLQLQTFGATAEETIHNLEWDPREENEVDFPHGWVLQPMAAATG